MQIMPDKAARPNSEERMRRLQELARAFEEGRYEPDLDALARRLVEKERTIFMPDRGDDTSRKDNGPPDGADGNHVA